MAPVSGGISLGCAIYVEAVISGARVVRPQTDPAIDQSPRHGSTAVGIIGKPSYAFYLHLTGKHHPGLTEIVPQMKISGLQLFAPGMRYLPLPLDLDLEIAGGSANRHKANPARID